MLFAVYKSCFCSIKVAAFVAKDEIHVDATDEADFPSKMGAIPVKFPTVSNGKLIKLV